MKSAGEASAVIIGIVCEDKGHFVAVTTLIDAVLVEQVDWLNGIVEHCRKWRGVHDGSEWSSLHHEDARDLRPKERNGQSFKRRGRIVGERREPDSTMWQTVLEFFEDIETPPEIVVLVRDSDGYDERLAGLNQARRLLKWPFEVVAAVAMPEIEGWHIAGFVPLTDEETIAHEKLRKELSFDPVSESHEIPSRPKGARLDSKKILARLCKNDEERKARCLENHERLRARGEKNGVATFLKEVEEKIVPLFNGVPISE